MSQATDPAETASAHSARPVLAHHPSWLRRLVSLDWLPGSERRPPSSDDFLIALLWDIERMLTYVRKNGIQIDSDLSAMLNELRERVPGRSSFFEVYTEADAEPTEVGSQRRAVFIEPQQPSSRRPGVTSDRPN